MTNEDKQLLLRDLSARLPYGVMVEVQHELGKLTSIDIDDNDEVIIYSGDCDEDAEIEYCKFYLRPISSMTEEEEEEFVSFTDTMFRYGKDNNLCCLPLDAINWLNAHHFDYRGLIERGLAIEVTKKNNPYKE